MPGEIISYGSGREPSREARRAARDIRRGQAETRVRQADIDCAADVAQAKLDNLKFVAGTALRDGAMVSQLQTALEMEVPASSALLSRIAMQYGMAIGEVINDFVREARRC